MFFRGAIRINEEHVARYMRFIIFNFIVLLLANRIEVPIGNKFH
jgi:hypothetical protein